MVYTKQSVIPAAMQLTNTVSRTVIVKLSQLFGFAGFRLLGGSMVFARLFIIGDTGVRAGVP